MAKSERVTFNGEIFRRYPDSKRRAHAAYFFSQRGRSLHRAIWEYHNGPIPEGSHVHHKDGNTLNNDISNLECIDGSQHMSMHMREPGRIEKSIKSLDAARVAAAEWHGSPEGIELHRRIGRDSWKLRDFIQCKCRVCGVDFQSKAVSNVCSMSCRAAERRRSGIDNESRKCEYCGGEFTCNKYSRVRNCSRSCGKRQADRAR